MTKEDKREYDKKRYLNNKSSIKSRVKKYGESLKEDFYTLYYLKEEHYIGITNQPILRLSAHKSKGRHVLDYEVITTIANKKEALIIEKQLHSIGYNGGSRYFFDNFY